MTDNALLGLLGPHQRMRMGQMLMAQQYDRPTPQDSMPAQRASILPLATYENGMTGPALPGLLAQPVESFSNLLRYGYTPGTGDTAGVEDAFNAAGGAIMGGSIVPRPSGSIGIGPHMTKARGTYVSDGLEPIHSVNDWAYVRQLIRSTRRGDDIPPILYEGQLNNGNLLAGTHRHAANYVLKRLGDKGRIGYAEVSDVLADPATYGLTKQDARRLRHAIADGELDIVDDIWDRR